MRIAIRPKKNIIVSVVILSFALIFIAALAYAQQPAANLNIKLPQYGKLMDSSNKPLTGIYDFKFEIYSTETGGSLLWNEEQKNIQVSKGLFQIYLGSSNPLTTNLAVDSALYSQIYIKTPSETSYKKLEPRILLNPTFAKVYSSKKSESADTAGRASVADILNGTIDALKVVSGIFDVARIPGLDAGKIITGIFDSARIPSLDAGKITSGIFDVARIPSLDAGKIASGIFDTARIPNLDAGKITSGNIDSRLSFKVSAGVSSVSDGATISFNSPDRKYGVTGFSGTPVVSCTTEKGYICSVASISTTSFAVGLISDAGNPVQSPTTKSVNWQATGS